MGKYLNKPHLVPSQEREIFPLMDAALALPYGKAVVYETTVSRANYLYRSIQGERYRNAIESIATYTPADYLYGKGLYYHLVVDTRSKGLIIANVENPPGSLTWDIINCAASKKPVVFTASIKQATSRLNKLKERFPDIISPIYVDITQQKFCYAIPTYEELIVVDIDVMSSGLPNPTKEHIAKSRQ